MKTIKRYGRTALAAAIVLAAAATAVWLAVLCQAEPVDTYHAGWQLVRSAADEDGSSFSAVYDLTGVGTTNGQYGDISTSAFRIPSLNTRHSIGYSHGSKWMFAICGKNYNNTDDTFSFDVVGWSKTNGMMHVIANGDGILGTQAVVTYPESGDALGELVSETSVTYTHSSTKFTVTNEAFENVAAGMLARVTGSNLTNAIVQVTTATDANNIVCSGVTSTNNNTDSTVQINPAFWADTINLDSITKWSGAVADPNTDNGYYQMDGNIGVLNSGNNNVALLVIDLMGLEYVQFVFYDCDGETGDEAGAIKVYGRPF